VVGTRHPAAAAGTPMCGRDPSARSAGDKRQRREGRLQVGFGQIYALFLARYTPCFWLKYTPKRRFWKTRRLLRGVFFGRLLRGVYFYGFAQCRPQKALGSFRHVSSRTSKALTLESKYNSFDITTLIPKNYSYSSLPSGPRPEVILVS
jgi:hypothetical protein